jgi:putative hydrolase
MNAINQDVAGRLEEAARLLRDQGADRYRVGAYLRAASSIRSMQTPVDALLRDRGLDGLKRLPYVGETIARAIRELVSHGRLPMLDRLRGESDPVRLLASVPGIGRVLANRLHDELGLETLADLESAAHDGRLAALEGFGAKRLAGIRDSLAYRLGRVRVPTSAGDTPSVSELLDVDREYRKKAAAGELQRIAPRRFNPSGDAWLPVLHTRRGSRRYSALFSNTARAHATGNARNWVVLYGDNGSGEHRHTVITATYGPLRGQRVVAGREDECRALYTRAASRSNPRGPSRRRLAARDLLPAVDDTKATPGMTS